MYIATSSECMRSEGYSTWSVCLCVCVSVCLLPLFLPLHATMRTTRHTIGFSIRKVFNFSLKMLHPGIMAIFAYSTKTAIFLTLLSISIPMERTMHLRKVCLQYYTILHTRWSVCGCSHAFLYTLYALIIKIPYDRCTQRRGFVL